MFLKWVARGALVCVLLIITVLSLGPVENLPQPGILSWDKVQHFLAYAVLSSLAILSFDRSHAAWSALAVGIFGLGIELLQPYFGRELSLGDLAANLLGVCVALGLVPRLADRLKLS